MLSVVRDRSFLEKNDTVRHGFFGKRGGVSTGIFSSLNCGVGSGDDIQNIKENRARVAAVMGVSLERILTLNQVHGASCIVADRAYDAVYDRPQADALVTDKPGLAIGILTADCAPVLFQAQTKAGKPLIGAAHAGWGGALAGILESTVESLKSLGADPQTIRAAIGPCIGPESYEVKVDFAKAFIAQDPENKSFFRPSLKAGHLMFDLPGYCVRRLGLAGVAMISCKGLDTAFNEEDFFSFRRATHRGEPDYGRQISVIVIE